MCHSNDVAETKYIPIQRLKHEMVLMCVVCSNFSSSYNAV